MTLETKLLIIAIALAFLALAYCVQSAFSVYTQNQLNVISCDIYKLKKSQEELLDLIVKKSDDKAENPSKGGNDSLENLK